MKKLFIILLILGSVLILSSTWSVPQETRLIKAGEKTGIPNKHYIRPIAHRPASKFFANSGALSAFAPEELAKIAQGHFDTSIKYRGVLGCDVDGDGRDELVADFGLHGIYFYDPYRSPMWTWLSSKDPEFMIAADHDGDGDYEIFCNWGYGNSSDYWEYGTGWHSFNNMYWYDHSYYSADVDGNGDEEIIVETEFIASGDEDLYIVGADGWQNWKLITWPDTNGGIAAQFGVTDDECPTYFASGGMQYWDYVSGDPNFYDNWTSMTSYSPDMGDSVSADVDNDGEQELCVDILNGLWMYDYSNTPRWTRINGNPVLDMRVCPFTFGTPDELLVSFSTPAGLWMYLSGGATKWERINGLSPDDDGGFCEIFNPDGDFTDIVCQQIDTDWDVAVDFGSQGYGLWKYDYNGSPNWTSMNGNDPVYMVRADLDGDGDHELFVKFSSLAGLWKWDDDTVPKWQRINGVDPN